MAGEMAVIHLAGPIEYGRQACSRCGYVFHDYEGRRPATLLTDTRDPMRTGWPEGEEVLVMGERGHGRCMGLVRQLRPDRDTSDEVRCVPSQDLQA
jgi:hypothetical protein